MKHHCFVAFVYVWFLHVEYIYQFLEDYEIHGDTQIFRVNLWMKRDVLKGFVRCICLYISTFLCFVTKELSGAADGPPRERRRGRRDDESWWAKEKWMTMFPTKWQAKGCNKARVDHTNRDARPQKWWMKCCSKEIRIYSFGGWVPIKPVGLAFIVVGWIFHQSIH